MNSASQEGHETHAQLEEGTSDGRSGRLAGKTVILCVGNRYLGDDGIGIRVADELNGRPLGENVVVEAVQAIDLSLLSNYSEAPEVVVVDALKDGVPPGTISRFVVTPRECPINSLQGLHALSLHDAFDIAKQTGLLTCPVTIFGVEPKDCALGEGLSPELENGMPDLLARVLDEIGVADNLHRG